MKTETETGLAREVVTARCCGLLFRRLRYVDGPFVSECGHDTCYRCDQPLQWRKRVRKEVKPKPIVAPPTPVETVSIPIEERYRKFRETGMV